MALYSFPWLNFLKKSTEHKIVILGLYSMKTEGIIINRLGNLFVLACLLWFNKNILIDLLIFAKLI